MQNPKSGISVNISEKVIEKIALSALSDIDYVSAADFPCMNFFRSKSPVSVKFREDVIEISVIVKIDIKARAVGTCEKVQSAIKKAVQSTVGIAVSKVNVLIAGIDC